MVEISLGLILAGQKRNGMVQLEGFARANAPGLWPYQSASANKIIVHFIRSSRKFQRWQRWVHFFCSFWNSFEGHWWCKHHNDIWYGKSQSKLCKHQWKTYIKSVCWTSSTGFQVGMIQRKASRVNSCVSSRRLMGTCSMMLLACIGSKLQSGSGSESRSVAQVKCTLAEPGRWSLASTSIGWPSPKTSVAAVAVAFFFVVCCCLLLFLLLLLLLLVVVACCCCLFLLVVVVVVCFCLLLFVFACCCLFLLVVFCFCLLFFVFACLFVCLFDCFLVCLFVCLFVWLLFGCCLVVVWLLFGCCLLLFVVFVVVCCCCLLFGCCLVVVCLFVCLFGWLVGWLLVVGCWLLVVGGWWLVVGGWLLVVGCWLLVVGWCWLMLLLLLLMLLLLLLLVVVGCCCCCWLLLLLLLVVGVVVVVVVTPTCGFLSFFGRVSSNHQYHEAFALSFLAHSSALMPFTRGTVAS